MLRTYRRAARWERKAQVNAKMGFVQQFMQYVDASIECSKIEPREVRNRVLRGPKSSPEGSKIEPGGVHERQDAPKRRPRAPKRRPRAPKTRPRSAQEVPNRRPGDPQRRPRASQTRPEWTPGRPQTEDFDIFWRPCKRPAFIKALASVFVCFVRIFAPSTSCKS